MVDIINLVNGVVERIDELSAAHGVIVNMCVNGSLAGIVLCKSHVSAQLKFAPNQSLLRTIYTFAAQQSMLRCAPKQQMVRTKVVWPVIADVLVPERRMRLYSTTIQSGIGYWMRQGLSPHIACHYCARGIPGADSGQRIAKIWYNTSIS